MKKEFTIEGWLKASFQILKIYWLEWVLVSVVTTVILSGIFYFSYQQIFPRVLEIIKDQHNWQESLVEIAIAAASYLVGLILFLNFLDLFLIHRTSSWYLGTNVSIETNLLKALSSMPMAILLSIAYIIMVLIAFMLCVFPVIFVSVFFMFIFQALLIENKGLDSFGRSIELVKQNFGNFLVIPFILSFAFQIIDTIPFYIVQGQLNSSITPEALEKMQPKEVFDLLLNSPYTFVFLIFGLFFFSAQSNLKSILYTVAFEEARKERLTEQTEIIKEDKFN